MMDKTEKLALARKKLRKFQSKMATKRSPVHPSERTTSTNTASPPASPGPGRHGNMVHLSAPLDLQDEVTTPFDEGPAHNLGVDHLNASPIPLDAPPTEEVLSHRIREQTAVALDRSHQVMEALRNEYAQERAALERQIKAHAQTVDILVSEKSSLQKEVAGISAELQQTREALGSSQLFLQSAKTHHGEVERERDGLRDRLAAAERDLRQAGVQVEQQQGEVRQLRAAVEEAGLEQAELVSKLQAQRVQCDQLERRCAQLQAQTMRGNPHGGGGEADREKMATEVQVLKEENTKLKSSVQQCSQDREELVRQVGTLQHQLEQERRSHLAELERAAETRAEQSVQLEELGALLQQAQQDKAMSLQEQALEKDRALQSTREALTALELEREGLSEQLSQEVDRSRMLTEEVTKQELQLSQLEGQVRRLSSDAVDQQALLQAMQEDKEALSRAMVQNKELKEQFSELQERFVAMTHQNMEVASELESEQFRHRQLEAALEEQLQRVEVLSKELAQQRPEGDGREREEEEGRGEGEGEGEGEHTDSPLVGEVLQVKQSLCEVEAERDGLSAQLQAVLTEREEMSQQVLQLINERDSLAEHLRSVPPPAPADESHDMHVTNQQYQELARNFSTLQDRFVKVMSRNAELLDQAQEAEHVVLALEGENATIGEYIALYQERRSALQEKFKEKDDFIDRLLGEREQLKAHLLQLQSAAEELVHTPCESPTHLPSVQEASLPVEEAEVSRERLLAVLGRMGPHDTPAVVVPCVCCSGEVINV